jgi:peptidyl-prolyl cis-trans isomerase C
MKHVVFSKRLVAAILPVLVVLVLGDANDVASAQSPASKTRVVARVGDAAITVGELERRLARIPTFQRAVYGKTPEEIKRNFLLQVLVPEVLFARGAVERGKDVEVQVREQDVLKTALLMKLRQEQMTKEQVPPAEIKKYYEDNIDRYRTPSRISVWRILVATREEAARLVTDAKAMPTPKHWSELARGQSLDKSTSLRGGNLGFLTADGTSADGKTKVDAALVKAASQVSDGEIVGEPVVEGSGFAVVWRRGSMPAVDRTLEQEAGTIAKILFRERAKKAQEELIGRLRAKHVTSVNLAGTEMIGVSSGGRVEQQDKPGRISPRAGRTRPQQTPSGLR